MKLCPSCQQCYEDTFTRCADDHAVLLPSRPKTRLVAQKYSLDRLLSLSGDDTEAIYAGTHLETDRPVAIKLLLSPPSADAEAGKHLRREAHAVAHLNTRIDHQHVAKTYDYGLLTDGTPYIITELVSGQSLRAYLKSVGHVPPVAVVVRIARQVADGLGAAHNCGVVHRALEPSSVILGRDYYGRLEAKIINFGFAKLRDLPPEAGSVNGTGKKAATRVNSARWSPYCAPEQLAGHNPDARSDIYSLGVILYEMLGGRMPREAPAVNHGDAQGTEEEWLELKELNADAPESLIRLIRQLVPYKAAARLSRAGEVAQQLRQIEQTIGQPRPAPVAQNEEADPAVRPAAVLPPVVRAQVFSVGVEAAVVPPLGTMASERDHSPEEESNQHTPSPTESLSRGASAGVSELTLEKKETGRGDAAADISEGNNENGGQGKVKGRLDQLPVVTRVETDTADRAGAEDESFDAQASTLDATRHRPSAEMPIGRAQQSVQASAILAIVLALSIGSGLWFALRGAMALPRGFRAGTAETRPENMHKTEEMTDAAGKDSISRAAVREVQRGEREGAVTTITTAGRALEESRRTREATASSRAPREQKDDGSTFVGDNANSKAAGAGGANTGAPLKQRSNAAPASPSEMAKSTSGQKKSDKCTISASEDAVIINNNGGSRTITVGLDGWSGPAQISAATANWSDIVVFSDPQARKSGGPVKYSIVSVSKKAGPYKVVFRSPCGSKVIPITVK